MTQGHGVMALVVGQIVQASLTMVLAWVVHPPVLPGWNLEDARGLLSYGGPYAGANLLELVQLNIDYLIVSRVLGGEALGQYSLAFRLAFMPYLMVVVVMSGAAFPYLCRQRGADLGRAAVTVMTAALTAGRPDLPGYRALRRRPRAARRQVGAGRPGRRLARPVRRAAQRRPARADLAERRRPARGLDGACGCATSCSCSASCCSSRATASPPSRSARSPSRP